MKKSLFATGLVIAMALPLGAQAADYVIDTKGAHASINFKVSHLGYSFIKGRFNTFSGDFSFDEKNIADSKVNVVIDTTSLDSNHAERDKHIRSGDFIDAGKYSEATFKSTKVVDKGNGKLDVTGDLTLHGVTKPITIEAEFVGAGNDPWGGERAGFVGTTRLELADFDIPVMGSSSYVDMELHIEGVKK
ncbi:YceI family protein [Vibrio parahaemolyticus]|uniref:YceI family protein n=1 Tax=Vibrio parahaemolyticus TaxID=670 RepID=UPI000B78F1C5|nr:YceI family protein [Vibrio parahaemolyticus]EGQ8134770.1 YceI family protein [Vibrio parahaemolyticus]EGQ8147029.1 YceI family protein [Vibrio parahaemolyticus]EGQ8251440.1 YceI family protein [Vibrio parahaemolyticus]EGQ8263603.1 YceI family protein [Vibrio parahaemolyticus]EGQ8269014.1 YceI family protein [Vibrio parahaemolyticus]